MSDKSSSTDGVRIIAEFTDPAVSLGLHAPTPLQVGRSRNDGIVPLADFADDALPLTPSPKGPADGDRVESILGPQDAQLLRLWAEGKTVKDVAVQLGDTPEAVRLRLHRACSALSERLRPGGP
jgi:hypothetical protein